MKARSTPISETKTQALARVLSAIAHGYTRICIGTVPPERLARLAGKFDGRYGIAHTRSQRVGRKRAGIANTLLAVYSPPREYLQEGERLSWALLATTGGGVGGESWLDVIGRPVFLDYEICRHNDSGEIRWTWRRTKSEMTQLYGELGQDLSQGRHDHVAGTLQRIAHQPGFHGIRVQSKALCDFARSRGFTGPLPHLFYVQKIAHGSPLLIRCAIGPLASVRQIRKPPVSWLVAAHPTQPLFVGKINLDGDYFQIATL